MNTHHPRVTPGAMTHPVTLVRRSLTTLLAALLLLAHVLPAAAQSKPAASVGAPTPTPVVRYIGMTNGVVGAPFVLRARVRDAVTGVPLPAAPVIFTLDEATFEATADATGVAEQVTQLTPELVGANVTARYGGPVTATGDLLSQATTDGGAGVSTANVTAAALTPASLAVTLAPGQSVVENKLATLPAAAQAAGDIVFAFDTTASMGFSLPATQGLAEDIMAALTADGLDVRFGATAFQDYAGAFPDAFGYPAAEYGPVGSYPHTRVQPLSADTAAVASAIYTLQAASSDDPGDPPGSYSRALYETVAELTPAGADPTAGALGYRPNARRMVALFGDDLPHDNDLNQGVPNTSGVYSTGGDPGRDSVLQETSNPAAIGVGNDDLDWQGVLATMQSNGVALLSYDLNPFTTDYWAAWAAATGGEHLFDYDGMVAALRGRLQSQSTAASVTLRASAGFESWVSVQPASYTDVALPASLPFSVTITPPVGTIPGVYTFRVELLNGARVEAWQNVAITVPGAANRAPTAVNDSFSVDEDSVDTVLAVLANDSDLDGDSLTVTAVTQPVSGAVTLVGGVVRYSPNANYNGADSFTYTVSDGGLTATATVALTVRAVNDAPTAVNDSFSVDEDSVDNVLAVLPNDSDLDGDSLTVTAVSQPANGFVTLVSGVVRYSPNANYNGADSFTYTVSDGALTATAMVALTVRSVNDAPTAVNDNFGVDEDSVDNALDVLANDSDIDGDGLSVTAVTQPANGVVTLVGGVVRYTPSANYDGVDSFTYTVSDGALTATATVALTVRSVNDAPMAVNDSFSVDEDSVDNVLSVLANDSDPDNDSLTVTAVTQPASGVVTLVGGVVRYTPSANYNGADSFTYTVSDGALTATATVALTVRSVNDAPTAVNDSFSVDEDSIDTVLSVLANDSDPDNDSLTVTAVTQPANGVVTLVGGGVRYTPSANYNGGDSFSYTASDGELTATASVTLTVRPINDAPTAGDDAFQVDRSSANNVLDVLANDSDIDGDSLTLVAVSSPDQGSVVISGTTLRYTPPAGYVGPARFTYTVSDGVLTATADVEVTVRAFNRAPTATDDLFTVAEDSGASDFVVLNNDSDPDNDPLVISAVTTPANGTTAIDGDRVRYTPDADFNGVDSFTYTVSDGGATATAQVTVTVTPVNDAPTAVNDSFSVDEDSVENVLNVLANDSDLDGDSLAVTEVTQPVNGAVTLVSGVVRYTPNPNYNGADSFTYTVSDGALSATATVALIVRSVNDAPTAVNDSFSVDEDSVDNVIAVLANDSDPDNDSLSVIAVTQPANGVVTLVGGVVRYTPNPNYRGADSFTYTISDGSLTATATVAINVASVNRAPVAVNDSFTVNENSAGNVFDVRANDSDPDNDALTIVAVGAASNGVVTRDGAVVRYTPNPNYRGADSFTYTISDGALTATATVAITVQPAAGAPGVMLSLAIEGSGEAGDGVISVGQTVTVVATITNTGQSVLAVVPLRLAVAPAVLEMISASLTPDSINGGMHVWEDVTGAGTLAPGVRTEVRVVFRSVGPSRGLPGQVMTAAGIVQGATDTAGQSAAPANAVAQVRVTAPQVAIATRMVSPAGGELKANQVLTMSVRITNTGDTLITTLPLRDRFDGSVLTFVRASVSGGRVTGSGASAQVAWTDLTTALGDLAPGQSVEVLITYRIKVVFWSSVRQSVVEGARDEYGDLLLASAASTTIYCMKLELTMASQPPAGSRVPRNAEIEYTLRLRTPGEAPLTNLVLRGNVTGDGAFSTNQAVGGVSSALAAATTCPVRAIAPSSAVQQTWVMDRLDAGASCTIVFKTKVASTRQAGYIEVRVEGMAAELLTPATVKARHSVTNRLRADIAAFAAASRAAEIEVFWEALSEEDVTGYHVWRSAHNELSIAERITAQPIAPDGGAQSFYAIVDALPDGADEAYYWLEVMRGDESEFVGPAWAAPRVQATLYLPVMMNNQR